MLLYLLQGIALALPTIVAPSPYKIFLISQALENGLKRTLPATLAPLITDGPIIVLVLLILTQTPDWFLVILRILGGFFVLYLARRTFVIFRSGGPSLTPSARAGHQSLLDAIVINFLNPNPYMLWGVVAGPIVLEGLRQSLVVGLSFIAGFYLTFVCGLVGLVVVFATVGKLEPRVNRILGLVSALALAIFGLVQIVTGVTALIG